MAKNNKKKLSGIRVFGGVVNSPETYVDYNIVGTDKEGKIYLENVNDPTDEKVWSNTKIQSIFEDELAMNGGDIPVSGDNIWDSMENLTNRRKDGKYNNFAISKIEEAQKALFHAAVEEGKDA